uniref:Myb/SANT-like domain-containing protein n=1 Tax=Opuntia streptacantha TaxID=393608 RepID=A0A7C9CN93_OPUST
MEKGKMKEISEDKKTQFRWSKPMSKELLKFLADEVKKGNRPNNFFKTSSFVAAANMISKKFDIKYLPDHVENHLRIVKNAWGIIAKLRNQSGCGWDENMKMIRMSPDVYNTYVEANPTHEKFLNKKIDMYDEMAVVVGKDVARGSCTKSFEDIVQTCEETINVEDKDNGDSETVKENDKQSTSSVPVESRRGRKRAHEDDSDLQNISAQMGEVVAALQRISKSKLDVDFLYQEVMRIEGFEEEFLASAFDQLVEH